MTGERCDLLCLDLEKAERLRSSTLPPDTADRRAREVKAVADPTRLTLVAALADGGELCVCDLAWILERAENLVSHHLRLLRSEDLVTNRRDGKMVMYALTERGRQLLDVALSDDVPA